MHGQQNVKTHGEGFVSEILATLNEFPSHPQALFSNKLQTSARLLPLNYLILSPSPNFSV